MNLDHIAEQLRPLAISLDELTADPDNVRVHDERNLRALRLSLAEFGQLKPIVAHQEDLTIIAGNGTAQCARDLGWTHVAAVLVNHDETTATRYAIADNRTAELAAWAVDDLAALLMDLASEGLVVPGFEEDADIQEILSQMDDGINAALGGKAGAASASPTDRVRFMFGSVKGLVSAATHERFVAWYNAKQADGHILLDDLIDELVGGQP